MTRSFGAHGLTGAAPVVGRVLITMPYAVARALANRAVGWSGSPVIPPV